MCTFTLDESERTKLVYRTRARLTKAGSDLDRMSANDQYLEKGREILAEGTKYLKRLRIGLRKKGDQVLSFRYLLVLEPHEDGRGHLHALIHELALQPITYDRLKAHWHLGFTKFNLVKTEVRSRYVAKYVGKYEVQRVRASFHYGTVEKKPKSARVIAHDLLLKQQQHISSNGNQKENIDPLNNDLPGVPTEGGPSEASSDGTGREKVIGPDP